MDHNALIVQHMLDREAEIAALRTELTAARAELERLGALLAAAERPE